MDDLKNRFASRFIFSYTIAWLIFNWKISIALFWYDKSQFEAEGCKSIFEFISDQLKINSTYYEVFWVAIIYTFGLPISKSLINIWDEVILDLRNWSKTKLVRSQDAKTIKELRAKISSVGNVSILGGYWEYKEYQKDLYGDNKAEPRHIYINHHTWYDILEQKKEEGYIIKDFYYNPNNSELVFTATLKSNFKIINRYRLSLSDTSSNQKMEGVMNDKVRVEFYRISE